MRSANGLALTKDRLNPDAAVGSVIVVLPVLSVLAKTLPDALPLLMV
jgi:hypothetical protein